ncbi:gp75 [Rhodococcus phage ReqiPine5]|uniref:Gp75 n=1 Tax=Rhodococcus phage ReqiPine5 TaxID=691963 RepID=D4P850_9CAUD|nr:gp75 [Rhodococcus phage ReqiPine5]ADD81180.1 gp75 [Rhodococcus phage ReqiPine5]
MENTHYAKGVAAAEAAIAGSYRPGMFPPSVRSFGRSTPDHLADSYHFTLGYNDTVEAFLAA